jgi:hypothetical protein
MYREDLAMFANTPSVIFFGTPIPVIAFTKTEAEILVL